MQYTCHLSLWIKQSNSVADRYHNKNFFKQVPAKIQTKDLQDRKTTLNHWAKPTSYLTTEIYF
jgi:hypothetical protein